VKNHKCYSIVDYKRQRRDRSGRAGLSFRDAWLFPSETLGCSSLESAHQNQDQENDNNKTQAAATVIARAIERSAADATEAAKKDEHEDDENDCSDRHGVSLQMVSC
jgi:hypothetical protein